MSQSRSVSVSSTAQDMQAERSSLEDFVADRARDFVGRQSVTAHLADLCVSRAIDGAPWGICVTGEPGSGKSALFGELLRRMKDTDVFILAHAAGASPRASSVDAMLRRWIQELGSALGIGDTNLAENTDPDIIEMAFGSLLGQLASQRRVVILIDGLDQFKKTARGKLMTWLPPLWPANARLVATAIAGGASKVLAERPGVEVLPLPPLDASEARGIINAAGNRYQCKFEAPVIDALLAKKHAGAPASGNPLWLVLALEQLELLDSDDFADMQRKYFGPPAERLQNLMLDTVGAMPTDILLLYRATFDRAAELLGAAAPSAFIGLIAASRAGWRESDFRQLLPQVSGEPWDEQRFAALRRLFRGQVRQHGDLAQVDFNHAQMRAAARSRLAALRLSNSQLHLLIADYLQTLAPDDRLRMTETMVHLLGSKDDSRIARYYGDSSLSDAELQGATRALADAVIAPPSGTPASAARDICRLLDDPDSSVCALVAERFLFNLGDAAERHIPPDARLIVLNSIERAFEQLLRTDPDNSDWQRGLSVSRDRVGDVLVMQGKLPEALKSFRDGLAIRERLVSAGPNNIGWQRDLSLSHEKIGDVLAVQGKLPEALKSFRDQLAIAERLASADPGNVDLQGGRSLSHEKVGDALMAQGNLPEALESFRIQLEINEQLARAADTDNTDWQRDRSLSYDRVGDVLVAQGNLDDALKSFRQGLEIAERLASTNPDNASWQRDLSVSHSKTGDVLVAQGSLPEGLKAFHDGLTIRERLAKADPDNVDWQRGLSVSYDRVGDVLMAQENLAEALKAFRDQFAIAERLAKAYPDNTGLQRDLSVSYEKLGDVLMTQGNLPDSLTSFRDGLAIRERLARADPGNPDWQRSMSVSHDCIGDVLESQGDLAEALKSFRAGLAIRERLALADPGSAARQRDLTVSYDRIGEVLESQGNLAEALKSFGEALAINERLALADPGNADLQRSVAVSQGHLADMYRRSNDHDNALAALQQGQAAMERVVRRSPDNAGWKKDLDWFKEQIETLSE